MRCHNTELPAAEQAAVRRAVVSLAAEVEPPYARNEPRGPRDRGPTAPRAAVGRTNALRRALESCAAHPPNTSSCRSAPARRRRSRRACSSGGSPNTNVAMQRKRTDPPIENHFGRPPRRAAVRFALPPPFGLAHAGASSLRSLPSVGDEKPAVGQSKSDEGSYGAGSGAAVLRSYRSSDAT